MKALFVELPAFERNRSDYLTDEAYRGLQNEMLKDPEAGDVITGTGGLRKLRYGDATRGKGKRGGLRVIYYWWDPKKQFWLFTIYDKDELSDLSPKEKAMLKTLLKQELEERK
jgi:mRNA-degrading endonuclease RelE of RelBE toxin-antitoxin system